MTLSQDDIQLILAWWEYIAMIGDGADEAELDLVKRLEAHAETPDGEG